MRRGRGAGSRARSPLRGWSPAFSSALPSRPVRCCLSPFLGGGGGRGGNVICPNNQPTKPGPHAAPRGRGAARAQRGALCTEKEVNMIYLSKISESANGQDEREARPTHTSKTDAREAKDESRPSHGARVRPRRLEPGPRAAAGGTRREREKGPLAARSRGGVRESRRRVKGVGTARARAPSRGALRAPLKTPPWPLAGVAKEMQARETGGLGCTPRSGPHPLCRAVSPAPSEKKRSSCSRASETASRRRRARLFAMK